MSIEKVEELERLAEKFVDYFLEVENPPNPNLIVLHGAPDNIIDELSGEMYKYLEKEGRKRVEIRKGAIDEGYSINVGSYYKS